MTVTNGVVAHFVDGRVLKGTIQDFSPALPAFYLLPVGGGPSTQIRINQLKGVFFVKNLDGDAQRTDLTGFISGPSETVHGKKVAVCFADGELMCGYSLSSTRRDGFFMFPADSGSNNQRVYVVSASAQQIAEGQKAEELVQKIVDTRAA